jgi:tRNA nucleotidyltransferase (CCA-adding enzyme)
MELFGKTNDVRFLAELKYILSEENPLPALQRLAEFDLFQFLWPDLRPHYKMDRRMSHVLNQAQLALSWFELLYLDEKCCHWMVYLLAIMSRSGVNQLSEFCLRFEESIKDTAFLLEQKELVDAKIHIFARNIAMPQSHIVTHFKGIEIEGLLYMMAIARKNHVKKAISLYVTTLRHIEPELSGKDLITMGYRPGPQFREILTFLKNAKLDGRTKTTADEQELLQRRYPLT